MSNHMKLHYLFLILGIAGNLYSSTEETLYKAFKDACNSGDVNQIKQTMTDCKKQQEKRPYLSYLWRAKYTKVYNNECLLKNAIHSVAQQNKLSPEEFTQLVQEFKNICPANERAALSKKYTRNSWYHKASIPASNLTMLKKIVPLLEDAALENIACRSISKSFTESTDYFMAQYAQTMLKRKFMQQSIHTTDNYLGFDPEFKAGFYSAYAIMNKLHKHTVAHNAQHHTILHDYVKHVWPHSFVINWLLVNKYNPNVLNEHKKTALDVIVDLAPQRDIKGRVMPSQGQLDAAQRLIEHGAQVSDMKKTEKILQKAEQLKCQNPASSECEHVRLLMEIIKKASEIKK